MDTTAFLAAHGLINVGIGTGCALAFRAFGRPGQIVCTIVAWAAVSTFAVVSAGHPRFAPSVYVAWTLGYGIAIAIGTSPLWFFRRESSLTRLLGTVAPVAFLVGYLVPQLQWLILCMVFGSCDP